MPENNTADGTASAAEQAEKRTDETRAFVRSVRRATRRRFTPEEKIRVVPEGFRRETTVSDLCRREGINPANYYPSTSSGQRSWTKDPSTGSGHGSWRRVKERLTRNSVRDATRQEIEELRRENFELKQITAELLLET